MSDVLSTKQRSYCMARIRGKNTKPELLLRKALWARGLRYRLKSRLPGKPDVVFPGKKIVIFVDGCFWHGCPAHFRMPGTAKAFWRKKLSINRKRDKEVNRLLAREDWCILRFWEHEVNNDLPSCVARVLKVIHESKI